MSSIGKYWFSTELDPIIQDNKNPHCFIHGYQLPRTQTIVEVLKTRINKEGEPDYWEPSRPVKRYGMEMEIPNGDVHASFHSKTRWNPIKKEVLYIDFRENLCAYDKYFYFGELRETKKSKTKQDSIKQRPTRPKTKQDWIRKWSIYLKAVAEKNLPVCKIHMGRRGAVNQLIRNDILSEECVRTISDILGKKYDSIRMIKHRFFDSKVGTTVLFGKLDENVGYSEAFAGSGESAVAMMIASIHATARQSLILLDEPETSLHPSAQLKLREYLLEQIKKKHHQIVLATHSPIFAQELPPEAIKVLRQDDAERIFIRNEALPQEAFNILGFPEQSKITVYVEDTLAQSILLYVLEHLRSELQNSFDIVPLHGGASYIMQKSLVANALSERQKIFYLLDGDQESCEVFLDPREIAEADYDEKIREYLHMEASSLGLPVRGDRREQKNIFIRKVLDYLHRGHLQYLPFKTPEKFVLESTNPPVSLGANDINGKETLRKAATEAYNRENINALAIDNYAQMLLGRIPLDCAEFKKIEEILVNMARSC